MIDLAVFLIGLLEEGLLCSDVEGCNLRLLTSLSHWQPKQKLECGVVATLPPQQISENDQYEKGVTISLDIVAWFYTPCRKLAYS